MLSYNNSFKDKIKEHQWLGGGEVCSLLPESYGEKTKVLSPFEYTPVEFGRASEELIRGNTDSRLRQLGKKISREAGKQENGDKYFLPYLNNNHWVVFAIESYGNKLNITCFDPKGEGSPYMNENYEAMDVIGQKLGNGRQVNKMIYTSKLQKHYWECGYHCAEFVDHFGNSQDIYGDVAKINLGEVEPFPSELQALCGYDKAEEKKVEAKSQLEYASNELEAQTHILEKTKEGQTIEQILEAQDRLLAEKKDISKEMEILERRLANSLEKVVPTKPRPAIGKNGSVKVRS